MPKILLCTLLPKECILIFCYEMTFVLNREREMPKYNVTVKKNKTPHDYRNTVTFESFLTSIKRRNMANMETLVKEAKLY